jgi:hypothetical protein
MALPCVLDASAAVRLIHGDPAAVHLAEQIREAPLVLASQAMLTELDPQKLLSDEADLVDRVEPDRHLQREALALARREPASLVTADRRLQQLAERALP